MRRTYGWCRNCGAYDSDHSGVYEANIIGADGHFYSQLCFTCLYEAEHTAITWPQPLTDDSRKEEPWQRS